MKPILYASLFTYALLVLLVWLFPLSFSASTPHSIWTNIAYAFTTSAGPYATFIILIAMALYYTNGEEGYQKKIKKFTVSLLALIMVFGIAAWLNENFTKKILKLPRPSHQYILLTSNSSTPIDSLYQLSKEARKKFFRKKITGNPGLFKQTDPKVLSHWVHEAGFSFPSGHSFNAFLLAMIFGCAIYSNNSTSPWKNLFLLPFIWALFVAISRVAMGAHTAADVSAGAGMGILLGLTLLYYSKFRRLLT
jgi:phosphatidylglycerophosphatase B